MTREDRHLPLFVCYQEGQHETEKKRVLTENRITSTNWLTGQIGQDAVASSSSGQSGQHVTTATASPTNNYNG